MISFSYPVGYNQFNRTKIMNYQLNRWHSCNYIPIEDCIEAGARIKTLDDFEPEMIR